MSPYKPIDEIEESTSFIKEDVKRFFLKSIPFILFLVALTILNTCNNNSYRKQITKDNKKLEQIYNKQLKQKQTEIEILQHQKDSLTKLNNSLYLSTIKKDSINTVVLRSALKKLNTRYEKDIDYVNNLSVDSSLLFLSDYLSQKN